jgi:aminomethyltransferase
MKRTKLYEKHVSLGAKIVDFAGFEMPLYYSSITEEHKMVRTKAGLFDVSHMGEFKVSGKEATQFVDYIFTNDVVSMNDNQVLYGMMCYPDGGVVDDLLVYKHDDNNYMLVVNASNIEKDFDWVTKNNKFDCVVKNESEHISEVALQGPWAEKLLSEFTETNLDNIKFFTFKYISVLNKKVLVSRTGYTGEDGFEIYGDHDDIESIWSELLKLGNDNIVPVGLGARDTLRFEVTLPLYGNELSKDITPIEAGYSFAVALNAGDFIGKAALLKQKQEGTKRRICGLEMIDKGIIRHGYEVYFDDLKVGYITTGYRSPSTGKTVALALIDRPYEKIGTHLDVIVRGKRKKVVVTKKKFYNKSYKK